jgi:dihydroorotate dehydrogenase (fumarate)
MAELKTRYMGIDLDNPLVVSSSGITGRVSAIERCANAGVGAVVLKSMFEEVIVGESNELNDMLANSAAAHPEIYDYVRADVGMRLGPLSYIEFIEKVRKKVSLPVIASINCTSSRWWVSYARRLESAGADGLELNISHFPGTSKEDSQTLEKRYAEIVHEVTSAISIPVAAKIGFYFTSIGNVMEDMVAAGAKALVLFNRYHAIDVDLETKSLVPAIKFSSPEELMLPLRWVGFASQQLNCDIAASTGVHNTESILKMLMVGATAVQVCSVLYRNGPGYIKDLLEELSAWLDSNGYSSVDEIRGLALRNSESEQALLTRIQYVKALEEASELYKY